jgi:hypothetical protein
MRRITRRDALKLAALASTTASPLAPLSGCTDVPRMPDTNAAPGTKTTLAAGAHAIEGADAVLGLAPLEFQWPTRDPFLFCVHHDDAYPAGNERMGPAVSLAGRELGQDFTVKDGFRMYHGEVVPGFPQHPHRGFETVTVVRRGLLDHSDSLGSAARYGRGDVQWLTAGHGIQHAEMFPLLKRDAPNPVELFQIWLNLPSVNKMVAPHFTMLWSHVVPRRVVRDAQGKTTELTVVAGRYGEITPAAPPPSSWAARIDSDVAIWTLAMAKGARFSLPAAAKSSHRALYFFRGEGLRVGGQSIAQSRQIELRADAVVTLQNGDTPSELLLLQGRPIGEPTVKHGPFVMNTTDEIRQAYADYQQTGFGGWPYSSRDPVHAREEGRFARHADGRIERPA